MKERRFPPVSVSMSQGTSIADLAVAGDLRLQAHMSATPSLKTIARQLRCMHHPRAPRYLLVRRLHALARVMPLGTVIVELSLLVFSFHNRIRSKQRQPLCMADSQS